MNVTNAAALQLANMATPLTMPLTLSGDSSLAMTHGIVDHPMEKAMIINKMLTIASAKNLLETGSQNSGKSDELLILKSGCVVFNLLHTKSVKK